MEQRKKVCVSLPYASQLLTGHPEYFGGAEVRGAAFATGLAEHPSLDVHVVVVGPVDVPPVRHGKVTIHTRPHAPWMISTDFSEPARKVWDQVDADVYLAFGANEASAEVAHYCKLRHRPFVLSVASDAAFDSNVFEFSQVVDAYGVAGHFAWSALHLATTVVAQTEFQQRRYRDVYGRQAVLIRNPAPEGHWAPPRAAPTNGGRMLWVGRLDPNKRYAEALRLAALLPAREMMIVCNNIVQLGASTIAELRRDLPNVMIADQVDLRDMPRLFHFADLLVNTSIVEGFPNTFLQAAMAGIPIVSLSVDPDGMLSVNGCGRVADNSVETLALETDTLLSDASAYAMAAANCRTLLRARHDRSSRITELVDVILHAASA